MTGQAVDKELVAARMNAGSREAQASTMIRFGGGLHIVRRHIIVEAQFEDLGAASWLQRTITDHYRHRAEMIKIVKPNVSQSHPRYSVRIINQGGVLALQTHLIRLTTMPGKARPVPLPVRGLPVDIDSADRSELEGVARGAFLAGGVLSDPERASVLEFACPGQESAKDLMHALKRLGYDSQVRQARSSLSVSLHDPDAIEHLLVQMGAPQSGRQWANRRLDGAGRGKANRLANFDDANMRRSVKAAVAAREKVRRAFDFLGDDVPESLRKAGELRLRYASASLEELGRYSDPPITKDAIAGRIRRLFQLAERVSRKREQ